MSIRLLSIALSIWKLHHSHIIKPGFTCREASYVCRDCHPKNGRGMGKVTLAFLLVPLSHLVSQAFLTKGARINCNTVTILLFVQRVTTPSPHSFGIYTGVVYHYICGKPSDLNLSPFGHPT